MDHSNSANRRRERIFRYAPLILWLAVIVVTSSTTGSMSNTSRFIRPFLEWLLPGAPEAALLVYHGYIRKFAHFAEYAVLGFLAARAFAGSSSETLRRFRSVFAVSLVVFVASLDELNQSFNAARTASAYDVLIDCAGGLTAVMLFLLVQSRRKAKGQAERIS
jgi:VanZ family protein